MIIFRERNPGVEYEYWLPPESNKEKKGDDTNSVNYNNEIQMLPFIPGLAGAPEKKKFGTIETASTKKQVTSYQGTPRATEEEERTPSNGIDKINQTKKTKKIKKSKKEKCGKCKRVKGRAEHYCRSSFAILIEVIDQAIVDGETRYDVAIEQTYKNQIHMSRREYLWVTNACPCPKLRTGGRYIATGDRVTSPETGESRLTLERENLVVKYKPALQESWDRLQRKERSICAKYA